MKILVTGAKGMLGTALCKNLCCLRDGKNLTRPSIKIDEIYEYDIDNTEEELDLFCQKADFVFHLAGVNRTEDVDEYMRCNYGFTKTVLDTLKKHRNKASIMYASSAQASLCGKYADSEYGISKKAAEDMLFDYEKETGANVFIYRFPNIMGHSRPNYNSAISTFCWAIANDEPYVVADRDIELSVLDVMDFIEGMYDLLEGSCERCNYEGLQAREEADGAFCYLPTSYQVTLGEIVDLLKQFKQYSQAFFMPKLAEGSFAKGLYSLYLTYLPKSQFQFALTTNEDDRGSFTELMKTADCGQISINVTRPGQSKGQHWHNAKWELFVVVSGHGLIQERNISTGECVEFEVTGDKMEAVYMIPGWTHQLINLSDSENLVTVMITNEVFDSKRPDTFFEKF